MPNAFIFDHFGYQTPAVVHAFCHKIGTTLLILEKRTQHTDRAKLYIGLLKEAVYKDFSDPHALIRIWWYFAERRAALSNLIAKKIQTRTQLHWVSLGIYPNYVNLDRMHGPILGKVRHPFQSLLRSLDAASPLTRMKAMKFARVYLRLMDKLSHIVHSIIFYQTS